MPVRSFHLSRNSFTDILRAILLSLEVLIEKPELQINGFVLIIDWSNFSFKQASKLTPNILKLAIEGLQVRCPNRLCDPNSRSTRPP